MLKKINPCGVKSDEFSIQITHPETMEYKEKDKILEFEVVYNPKIKKIYVNVWKEKNLSDFEKNKIKNNIKEAVSILEGNYEVL